MINAYPEDKIRWGTAIGLLSLDRCLPYYALMGLAIEYPDDFLLLLRNAILENRKEFEANPKHIPDVAKRTLISAEITFGISFKQKLENWVSDVFIFNANDSTRLSTWYYLFGLSRKNQERLDVLRLPPKVLKDMQDKIDAAFDVTDAHAIEDTLESNPLSKWDMEMLSLHDFDSGNEPYNFILETIRYKRFKDFLLWLLDQMNVTEQQTFLRNAERLKGRIPTISDSRPLFIPRTERT